MWQHPKLLRQDGGLWVGEMLEQDRTICEALGSRKGMARAFANLGACYVSAGVYATALTFYKSQHAIATELKIGHEQADAVMPIGVALRLHM